jgi:hypothetical protein
MSRPPLLDPAIAAGPIQPRYALLINPFYPKDPNASFGKHVLTPSLALTSFAATTPEHWQVRYWDENLLDGRPPFAVMPEVVGITVHLTFATRAFELAQWYRSRGSKVVLGGLHVLSCPEECAPHADSLAVGDGVQLWPRILADVEARCLRSKYVATYESDYREDPAPRRSILPRRSFLTTTSLIATRGCHNRCGFCYLATDGLRVPYRMRDPHQVAEEFLADRQPYAVFIDNNLGSNREYLRELCHALGPLNKIWSAAVSIDVTDDPSLIRAMALAGCTGVFVGFESLTDENLADARKKTPKTADYSRRVLMLHENGIQVNGSFVLGFDHDRKDVFTRTAGWIEENRLECATFHILTPYPATPLFRQMETEGRLLHRDWALYDTAHPGVPPQTHVTRGTGTRLCLDVSAPLLTRLDLAAPARGLARRCAVPGDVVPVQAIQPVLAPAHQTSPGSRRVATDGRGDTTPPPTLPRGIGCRRNAKPAGCQRGVGRRLAELPETLH